MAPKEKFDKEKFGAAPSPLSKAVAKKVAKVFGGKPSFGRFFSDDRTFHVDLITAENCPDSGVTSAGTVGMSDHAMRDAQGVVFEGTRLELLASFRSEFSAARNVLFYSAFHILRTPWVCSPGSVLEDVLRKFEFKGPMRHLVFDQPFLWPDLTTLEAEGNRVSWLLAVPISEEERKMLKAEGMDKFGQAIDASGVDIFDWARPSIG